MIDVADAELILIMRQLIKDITQTYNHWIFLQRKKALFDSASKYYLNGCAAH